MRTGLQRCCMAGVAVFSAISWICGAEETAVPRISSAPARIAIFKNGLGYVERKSDLPKGVLTAELDLLPVPVHGTFWVCPETKGVELRGLLAKAVTTDPGERDVSSMMELLDANDGRDLELVIVGADGKPERIKGKLRILRGSQAGQGATDRLGSGFSAAPAPPPASAAVTRSAYRSSLVPAAVSSPSLLLVETEQGELVIEKTAVRQIFGKDLRVRVKEQAEQQIRSSLKLDVAKNDKGATFNVSYLAKGIAWAPSYRLEILDDKLLRIHAKAQVFNDLEDLDGAQCSVIAGFPNLQFANVVDPMAFSGDLVAWLQNLAAPAPAVTRRDAVMTQQVMFNAIGPNDGREVRSDFDPAAFAGRGDADLFHYELGPLHLKQGERGYYPLFTADVPYEDVYDCRIRKSQQTSGERGEEFSDDVWHALRLHNNSKQPWTTAPATVTKDGLILGQDTMYFTSLGSRSLLRFTKALDVRASIMEKELDRRRNIEHLGYARWDLVTAEATISLLNLKPVEVTVVVQRTVEGDITLNPQEAELSLTNSGITSANPTVNLTWDIKIKPRETVKLTYTYMRYVR